MKMKNSIILEKSNRFAQSARAICDRLAWQTGYALREEMVRSATSVNVSVREAQNEMSPEKFIGKLSNSQKECDETIHWLELLGQAGYLNEEEFNGITAEAHALRVLIRSTILNTRITLNHLEGVGL